MKKSTAFGSVLCSVALAMGMAIPAFAASPSVETATNQFTTETPMASTVVKGITSDSTVVEKVLNATVPLAFTVVLPNDITDTDAHAFQAVPTTYGITNGSTFDVKVTGMKGSAASNDWSLLASDTAAPSKANGVYLTINGIAITGANNDITNTNEYTIATNSTKTLGITGGVKVKVQPTSGNTAFDASKTYDMVNVTYTIAEA